MKAVKGDVVFSALRPCFSASQYRKPGLIVTLSSASVTILDLVVGAAVFLKMSKKFPVLLKRASVVTSVSALFTTKQPSCNDVPPCNNVGQTV